MSVTFSPGSHSPPPPKSKSEAVKKRKSSLKPTTSFPIDDEEDVPRPARKTSSRPSVAFVESVTVRSLPQEEAEDAAGTRKGEWIAAPDHDELWDGDNKDFWEEEKTIDEVRRIVVIRGMRMALQYNLGYAFFSTVANFRKRHEKVKYHDGDDDGEDRGMDEMVIQYDKAEDEEMAIRKEIRELFADSVKGLDFPDLVQDREAFEKLYLGTVLLGVGLEDRAKYPEAGLHKIQKLVDEIMYVEDVCCLVDVVWTPPPPPLDTDGVDQKKHEKAADEEQSRRTERRKSVEMTPQTVASLTTTRRASLTRRAVGEDPVVEPTVLTSSIERRPSVERRGSDATRRLSLEGRSPIVVDEVDSPIVGSESGRRLSLERRPVELSQEQPVRKVNGERRPSITPIINVDATHQVDKPAEEEDVPLMPARSSDGRRASIRGRRPSVDPGPPSPAVAAAVMAGANVAVFSGDHVAAPTTTPRITSKHNPIMTLFNVILSFIWAILSGMKRAAMQGSNHSTSATTSAGGGRKLLTRPNTIPRFITWLLPLLIFVWYEMRWAGKQR